MLSVVVRVNAGVVASDGGRAAAREATHAFAAYLAELAGDSAGAAVVAGGFEGGTQVAALNLGADAREAAHAGGADLFAGADVAARAAVQVICVQVRAGVIAEGFS